ncbi:hypothetical protein EDF60_0203 [Leucobacter luti]|nr:hypothetical protein EDF60_0203 [Leucobacter luti]
MGGLSPSPELTQEVRVHAGQIWHFRAESLRMSCASANGLHRNTGSYAATSIPYASRVNPVPSGRVISNSRSGSRAKPMRSYIS